MADTSKTIDIVVELRNKTTKALKEIETNVKAVPKATGGILTALQRIAIGSGAILGTIKSFVFSFKGLLAAGGVALTAKSFLDVAESFEKMELKLNAITKGGGRQTLEALSDLSMEMPVNLQQLVDTFTMLQSQGLEPTEEKLKTLVNVGQVLGEQTMPLIADSMSLMSSRGEITQLMLTSLTKAGINVGQYLQDAFGKGMGVDELRKSSHTIEEIINAIWKGLDAEFSPYAQAAGNSWGDLWQLFINHVKRAQRQIMGAGVFDELKKGVALLTQEFDKWWAANEKVIIQNIPVYIEKVKNGVKYLWDETQKFYKFFTGLPDDLVGIAGWGIIGRILWGGPKGFLLGAFAVGKKIGDLITEAQEGITTLEGLKKKMQSEADELQTSISALSPISQLEKRIEELKDKIKDRQQSAVPEIFKTEYIQNNQDEINRLQKQLDELIATGNENLLLSPKNAEMLDMYKAKLETLQKRMSLLPGAKPLTEKQLSQRELDEQIKGVSTTGKKGLVTPPVDKPGLEKPTIQMELQAQLDILKNAHAVELDELDYRYDQGIVKSKAYYDEKKALLENNLKEETKLLQAIKGAEKEPIRKFTVDQTIIKTKQDTLNQLTQLERKYKEGTSQEREQAVQDELIFLRSSTDEQTSTLEYLRNNSLISEEKYYTDRFNLIKTSFEKETALLNEQVGAEENLKKRKEINRQIVENALETSKQLVDLAREREEAIRQAVYGRLAMWSDIRAGEGIAFKDSNDAMLNDMIANLNLQYQEQKKYFKNIKEEERWLAAQRQALTDEYLASTSIAYNALYNMSLSTAEAIGQAFSNYFFDLMTGRFDSLREIAYNALLSIQQIAANVMGQIATDWLKQKAIEFIGTSQLAEEIKKKVAERMKEAAANSAVSASILAQVAPVYALASAYRALALAKAMAGVATGGGDASTTTIRGGEGGGYGFAEGGPIPGTSPHPKADNIPIWATAGEFIHPVKTVQHYGKVVMEGIRKMAYSKDMFLSPIKDVSQKASEIFTTRDLTKELVEKTPLSIKSLKSNIVKHLYNFIGAQKKSGGGTIEGHSPTPTSDNIPIWATAGEFMHPVKTVQHYGREIMEGIRQRAIPKEVFSALRFPSISIPPVPKMSYAMGGEVASAKRGTQDTLASIRPVEVKIANFVDPSEVGNFLSSVEGEDAIINALSSRITEVRRIIR